MQLKANNKPFHNNNNQSYQKTLFETLFKDPKPQ
jgi:hypothetical protein